MKILLVDDDLDLLAIIAFALNQSGYLVIQATDGLQAMEAFDAETPDLAIVDINLPRLNGFDVAKRIRQQSRIPVIMLTARTEEEDVVRALGLGADDYLTKPFSPKILIARVKALLRRAGMDKDGEMKTGRLVLRTDDLMLDGIGDSPVALTPLEVRFLQLMIAHAGRTVATERILSYVWGNRAGGNRQLLKQLVHRLRQKLDSDPARQRILRTVPNAGYVLDGCFDDGDAN
jgi:DNA-binding response OmpR family regulator